jgi:hypothetical protein
MKTRFLAALALLALPSVLACGAAPDDEGAASSTDDLSVDRVTLPTAHTTLLAGDPYSPVLDERPLVVAGNAPCLVDPKVVVTPGTASVEASFLSSSKELRDKLDLSVAGIPINVRGINATGTARLAVETKFKAGSVNLMFQAKGTFDSELRSLGAEPEALHVDRIAKCGWGYVRKAHHRLSAVVMVNIEAADDTKAATVGCPAGETGCVGTGISTGAVEAKVALETMLRRGSFNISIKSVADVIPGLAPAPLGDIAALSSTPDTSNQVLEKLGRALDWLGTAQTTISERITELQANPLGTAAPTISVDFAYYPGLSTEYRERLGRAFDEVLALEAAQDQAAARTSAWQVFDEARAAGRGHFFNVPTAPVKTVDELVARREELLGSSGKLTLRNRELESAVRSCTDVIGNREAERPVTDTGMLVARIERLCKASAAQAWETDYEATYGIKRLVPMSVERRQYDEWRDAMCPPGQRIPTLGEAAMFSPWSYVTASQADAGIWLRRESFVHKSIWLKSGKTERMFPFTGIPNGFSVCFRENGSLFE